MKCPYCKAELVEQKYDYHHMKIKPVQPVNTILSTYYQCPDCGVGVEVSQQVRITPTRKDFVAPVEEKKEESNVE